MAARHGQYCSCVVVVSQCYQNLHATHIIGKYVYRYGYATNNDKIT